MKIFLLALFATPAFAGVSQTCFTPQQDCTALIVSTISAAKKSIDVQAYSFTSAPILAALAQAEGRGVDVQILLDKSNVSARYDVTNYLQNHNIFFLIDNKPAIAHNKVMVIDGITLITGSFNFTKAAQYKNAENVFIIQDASVSQQYIKNFLYRKSLSESLQAYLANKKNR